MSPSGGRPDGLLPAQDRSRRLPRGVVAETPGPGQTSVWDHPRPPLLRADPRTVVVVFGGVVCRTSQAFTVLETSHPPTWYLPASAFVDGVLRPAAGASVCEWKGRAAYLDLVAPDGRVAASAAWTYPGPTAAFAALAGPRRAVRGRGGRGHGRRRGRPAAAGGLLRRLGDRRRGRPVQGRPREHGLVIA